MEPSPRSLHEEPFIEEPSEGTFTWNLHWGLHEKPSSGDLRTEPSSGDLHMEPLLGDLRMVPSPRDLLQLAFTEEPSPLYLDPCPKTNVEVAAHKPSLPNPET
jgi:hypothetical protein